MSFGIHTMSLSHTHSLFLSITHTHTHTHTHKTAHTHTHLHLLAISQVMKLLKKHSLVDSSTKLLKKQRQARERAELSAVYLKHEGRVEAVAEEMGCTTKEVREGGQWGWGRRGTKEEKR